MDKQGLSGASAFGTGPSQQAAEPAVSALRASVPDAVTDLIVLRDIIRGVPQRWRSQYGPGYWSNQQDKQAIQRALDSLDLERCLKSEVDQIIGNTSWTNIQCDLCDSDGLDVAVHLGEDEDYEARYVYVCLPCLERIGAWAAQVMSTGTAKTTQSAEGQSPASPVPQGCAKTPSPPSPKDQSNG